jgi:hypothetical protein
MQGILVKTGSHQVDFGRPDRKKKEKSVKNHLFEE